MSPIDPPSNFSQTRVLGGPSAVLSRRKQSMAKTDTAGWILSVLVYFGVGKKKYRYMQAEESYNNFCEHELKFFQKTKLMNNFFLNIQHVNDDIYLYY